MEEFKQVKKLRKVRERVPRFSKPIIHIKNSALYFSAEIKKQLGIKGYVNFYNDEKDNFYLEFIVNPDKDSYRINQLKSSGCKAACSLLKNYDGYYILKPYKESNFYKLLKIDRREYKC